MIVIPARSVSIGWVHSLVFEGDQPSWDVIRRIVYFGEPYPMLVSHNIYKNRLTNYSVEAGARLWVDKFVKTPNTITLGTGSPPGGQDGPLATDTALWTEDATTEKTVDIKTTFMTIYSEFGATYQTTEINGTQYTEAGLFDADGNMWAHAIIDINKTSSQTATVLWKVKHEGN